jgi:hypothetical protein
MPDYDFPVPRDRGIPAVNECDATDTGKCAKDIIMHMLLARIASEDGTTTELSTIFNPLLNALEIDVPEDVLEAIENIGVGPNLQRFMTWIGGTDSFDSIQFTTGLANPAHSEGLIFWDNTSQTLAMYNEEADITLQIGQEQWLIAHNHTGSTIANGQAVRILSAGAHGHPTIGLAQADAEGTAFVVGLATHNIEATHDEFGFVTTFGIVRDLDTSAFTEGDRLWLSPTVAGGWTNVLPTQPNITTEIGIVTVADADEGQIFVNPQFADYYTKSQVDNLIASATVGGVAIPNVLTVAITAGTGDLFNSIEDAIIEINSFIGGPNEATATNPYLIRVTPGSYTENPVTVPSFVVVQGDNDEVCLVDVSDDNSPLFTMDDDSAIYSLEINGPVNDDCIFIAGGNGAEAVRCRILGGLNGVHADGVGTNIRTEHLTINGLTNGLYATDSGRVAALSCGTILCTNGFFADGGIISAITCASASCTNGLHADDGGVVTTQNHILDGCTNSIRISNTGADSEIEGALIQVVDGSTWDILQESTTGIININSARFSATKLSMVNPEVVRIDFSSDVEGDEGYLFFKELQVGSPEIGRETVLGEGDSYTRDMVVYTFNPIGSVYTNVSTAAASASGSTFTFPDVAVNNAIYVGSNINDEMTSAKKQFLGIKASIDTAVVLGAGAIIAEYWDGTAGGGSWVEFDHMSAGSNAPYTHYADAIFERTGSEQIRFDNLTDTTRFDWAVSDDPSFGTDLFWVRFKVITAAITTAPIFEQFKVHSNRTEINADGFLEHMGLARKEEIIHAINLNNTTPVVGKSPGNAILDFSTTINFNQTGNLFANNASDGFGQAFGVPEGLDTSLPLIYIVRWAPTSNAASGVVALDLSVGQAQIGTVLDGTNAETTFTELTTTTLNTANQIYEDRFVFSISESLPEEGVFFVLQRQASGGTGPTGDTYGGNIKIVNTELFGQFWH